MTEPELDPLDPDAALEPDGTDELPRESSPEDPHPAGKPGKIAIQVDRLVHTYRGAPALRDVTLQIPEGQICGLVGSNGAGKTTLLRILSTILKHTGGKIVLAGCLLPSQATVARQRLGYMPDRFACYEDLRVDTFLEMFAHLYSLDRRTVHRTVNGILELVDLTSLRHATIRRLSLGVRQRLSLARALLHNPKVLLLDEPISGLDPRARVEMRELLKELGAMGKTVLISSHVLSDLSTLCDRYVILEKGSLVFDGTLEDMKQRVAPHTTLRIEVPDRRQEAITHLSAKPWVLETEECEAPGEFRVRLASNTQPVEEVSQELFQAGFSIRRFEEEELELQDAFLALTKGLVS